MEEPSSSSEIHSLHRTSLGSDCRGVQNVSRMGNMGICSDTSYHHYHHHHDNNDNEEEEEATRTEIKRRVQRFIPWNEGQCRLLKNAHTYLGLS
jgi:hypothetical protein